MTNGSLAGRLGIDLLEWERNLDEFATRDSGGVDGHGAGSFSAYIGAARAWLRETVVAGRAGIWQRCRIWSGR